MPAPALSEQSLPDCPMCGGRLGVRSSYRRGPWGIHLCQACGHGVTLPVPGADELRALYDAAEYYTERGMSAPATLQAQKVRVEGVRSRVGGRTLLDVGAGTGGFLAAAAQVGYGVTGTELSEAGVRTARERYGLELRRGPFTQDQFGPDERFDVVTMLHVLEHLSDPVEALSLAQRLLADGGALFIEVPNRCAFAARFPGRWARQVFDLPLHLHHFTPASLEQALVRSGFGAVDVHGSIPVPLDRGMALVAGAVRTVAGRRRGPAPPGGGTVRPEAPSGAGGRESAPARVSAGARLVRWVRESFPGYKITAVARPAT